MPNPIGRPEVRRSDTVRLIKYSRHFVGIRRALAADYSLIEIIDAYIELTL